MSALRSSAISFIALLLFGPAATGVAYELRTHGEITRKAFDVSTRLTDYLKDLDLLVLPVPMTIVESFASVGHGR